MLLEIIKDISDWKIILNEDLLMKLGVKSLLSGMIYTRIEYTSVIYVIESMNENLAPHAIFIIIHLISLSLPFWTRFNMPHDDNPKCKEAGIKHQYHVMAPTLNYDTNPWSWSKCSRKYITEFLE